MQNATLRLDAFAEEPWDTECPASLILTTSYLARRLSPLSIVLLPGRRAIGRSTGELRRQDFARNCRWNTTCRTFVSSRVCATCFARLRLRGRFLVHFHEASVPIRLSPEPLDKRVDQHPNLARNMGSWGADYEYSVLGARMNMKEWN